MRAATGQDIRATARALLSRHGREGVTLRAIARELGITAPALYRYFTSRDDLLDQLTADICTALGAELAAVLDTEPPDDQVRQVYAVCRTFRRWALAHPQEFGLVFASPGHGTSRQDVDQFGRVFLGVVGQVMTSAPVREATQVPPPGLHEDLTAFRDSLLSGLADAGVTLPAGSVELDGLYEILRFWVRLYGHVALEVFDRFPVALVDGEALFESMLRELLVEFGLLSAAELPTARV